MERHEVPGPLNREDKALDWAFVLLRHVSVPRVVVWRVRTSHLHEPEQAACFEVVLPGESGQSPRRNR